MILADTSAWIEFLRGRGTPAHLELRTRLRSGDVAFTDPVQMEILAGARNRNQLIELSRLFFSLAYLPVAGRDDWDDAASMYRAARRADAHGLVPSAATIRTDSADRFDTEVPTAALAAHLRACGVPAAWSRSAGSYLCNFLYYHSLDWARRQPDPRLVLFVQEVQHRRVYHDVFAADRLGVLRKLDHGIHVLVGTRRDGAGTAADLVDDHFE